MCVRTIEKASVRWLWRHWNKYRGFYSFFKVLSIALAAVILAYKAAPANAGYPFQQDVVTWLLRHRNVVIFLLTWPFATQLIEKIYSWRLDIFRPSDELSHDTWRYFVAALNNVVGQKSRRFAECPVTSHTTGDDIFQAITKPEQQIANLISSLFAFIQYVTNDSSLKIVLAEIENNKPVDWLVYLPLDRVPSRALLQKADQTLFAYCALNGEKVVISDIAKVVRQNDIRYIPGTNPRNDRGSILCYPIEHPYADNRVIYSLSMKSDKVDIFNKDFIERCDFMIESFITRLIMESSLTDLKKGVEGHEQNH